MKKQFYKKASDHCINNINVETREIAIALKINDRMEKYQTMDPFCTLKNCKA